jgi:hypothetical protein
MNIVKDLVRGLDDESSEKDINKFKEESFKFVD